MMDTSQRFVPIGIILVLFLHPDSRRDGSSWAANGPSVEVLQQEVSEVSEEETPSSAWEPAGESTNPPASSTRPGANPPGTRVLRLTLPQALALAFANNPGLKSAAQGVKIARGRQMQSRSPLVPQVVANTFHTWQTQPNVNTGGLGSAFGGGLFAKEVVDKRATLSLSLLNLSQAGTASAARHQFLAAFGDFDKAEIDLATNVKRAFYDHMLADELVDVNAATVEQVERQLRQALQRLEAGATSKLDALRTEVQLANGRAQLIEATSGQDLTRQTMANLLNIEPDTVIDTDGEFVEVGPVPNRAAAMARARATRPDLNAARERVVAAERGLRAALAGYYPTVNATGVYDKSQGQRFPLTEQIEISSATVTVNLPVFDGLLTAGRVQEARGLLERARRDHESLEQTVLLEVARAISQVNQARAVIEATGTAIRQAGEAVEIAEEAYRQGIRTYLEVLDAQLALAQSQTNRARARRDYSVARAALDQAQGLLTGMEMEPVAATPRRSP